MNDLGNDPQLLEAFDFLVKESADRPDSKTFDARRLAAWDVLRAAIRRAEQRSQDEEMCGSSSDMDKVS